MSTTKHSISKSSFLKFEQCPKSFFLYRHFPYLRDKLSTDKQLTFKRGHLVGHLAQSLFPGGTDISRIAKNSAEAVAETANRVAAKEPVLYEASFMFEDTLVIADLLVYTPKGYEVYEVKSSLRVSDTYVKDACMQYYVIHHSIPIHNFYIVTLNPDYQLQGELDVKKLFKRRSVLDKAKENVPYFKHQLERVRLLLDPAAAPQIELGKHCFKPYQCDFFGHCWKNELGPGSIFEMPMVGREKVWDWHQQGIRSLSDLKDADLEREQLIKVRTAIATTQAIIDKQGIRTFMEKVDADYVVMDMEVFSPPVPRMQGTGPFYQLPFLASFTRGEEHHSFFVEQLDEAGLLQFAESLLSFSARYKTVLVYDKNLEAQILQALSQRFTHLQERLLDLKSKLLDISEVFKQLHYYDPAFKGSFSLKTVIAALAPSFQYQGIGSGLEAMQHYEVFLVESNPIEREVLKAALQAYCESDTHATELLYQFLKKQL